MNKLLRLALVCFLIPAARITITYGQELKHCGTTEMLLKMLEQQPELLQAQEDYDQQVHAYAASESVTRDEPEVYIIPMVFHVIHNYGTEDISDAQIEDEVRILNEDYRKLNPDTVAIVNAFLGIASDAHLEFRLAKKTPGGGCTTGIDRIMSHETYQGDDGSKLSQWPRNMYLNVWTVNKMEDGVAGYAYFPATVQGSYAPYDGVIILSDYIGSIGSSNPYTSRALTHEIGHTLNLPHTWGLTNAPGVACGDDGIFDTPETKGWTSCNLTGAVCHPGVIENVQNYMEYAYCSNMFTDGQVQIMRGVLNNTVSGRNNLWTATNLENTGTADGYVAECPPRADFNPDHYYVCQGADINFTDYSWSGAATSWSWDFPGGTPATSTEENPVVIFNEPGKHTVTLTASNAAGYDVVSKDIYVSAPTAEYAYYYIERFEDSAQVANDWIIRNVDNNDSHWSVAPDAAYNGSHSMMLNNFKSDKGDVDYLITPSMDLSGMPVVNLSFYYAGASATSNSNNMNDLLKIYASTNCGETWVLRSTMSGLTLINNGAWGSSFKPGGSSNNWSVGSLVLPSTLATSNVRFKFEFTGGTLGNNFYIDDVTVSSFPVGINAPSGDVVALNVFPNPGNGDFQLTYNLPKESNVRISIVDLTGRELLELVNDQEVAGNHQQSIHAGLNTGIYMLRVEADGESHVKKLVIE